MNMFSFYKARLLQVCCLLSFMSYQQINAKNEQIALQSTETSKLMDNVQAVITTMHNLQDEIEWQIQDNPEQEYQADILVDVMIILIEMYQKIVEVTVTHCLIPHAYMQQNLHEAIIKIIAKDSIRIISLLCQKFIHFIFNHQLSWQEKAGHCAWVLSVMYIIKLNLEKMPTQPVSREQL